MRADKPWSFAPSAGLKQAEVLCESTPRAVAPVFGADQRADSARHDRGRSRPESYGARQGKSRPRPLP